MNTVYFLPILHPSHHSICECSNNGVLQLAVLLCMSYTQWGLANHNKQPFFQGPHFLYAGPALCPVAGLTREYRSVNLSCLRHFKPKITMTLLDSLLNSAQGWNKAKKPISCIGFQDRALTHNWQNRATLRINMSLKHFQQNVKTITLHECKMDCRPAISSMC